MHSSWIIHIERPSTYFDRMQQIFEKRKFIGFYYCSLFLGLCILLEYFIIALNIYICIYEKLHNSWIYIFQEKLFDYKLLKLNNYSWLRQSFLYWPLCYIKYSMLNHHWRCIGVVNYLLIESGFRTERSETIPDIFNNNMIDHILPFNA